MAQSAEWPTKIKICVMVNLGQGSIQSKRYKGDKIDKGLCQNQHYVLFWLFYHRYWISYFLDTIRFASLCCL